MPTLPGLKMLPGMMPILHSLAVITPGQFGPIKRDFDPDSERFTLHHVQHRNAFGDETISGISASIAPQIASAAPEAERDHAPRRRRS